MKLDIFFLSFLFFLKFAKCGELYFPKIAEAIFPGPAFFALLFSHQEESTALTLWNRGWPATCLDL